MPVYQRVADRVLSPLVDRAIAVSGSTADFLVNERFVPRAKVRLIWNGAPLDEFAPVSSEAALAVRRELGLPVDALVVGTIGRLSAQKGHRHLLDAAAPVLAALPGVRFLIAGDGDLALPLKQQARTLGIDQSVVFAGHRSDVPALLGAIDVLAISSLYEGTPLTLFEAMAAGKPIVSTAVDGCREVIEDGRTGLLVAAGDSPALAAALLRVLRDAELRNALGRAALEASARFDIRECVAQMEALYDETLAERAARA
jgi:glycosyltransferase involved in cell wall biosynthesis